MRIEQNNKGIKEKEEKSDEIRLAHNFNFISMYLCIQHQSKIITASTMVDQAATKVETSNGTHGESSNEKKVAQGNKTFKRKGLRNSNTNNKKYEGVPDLLKGVGFTIARWA